MLSPFVIEALEVAPNAFFHVIDDVRAKRYRDRIEPERFDLVEMVAHLADLEDLFLERMRLAYEYPGSECSNIDPDARCTEKHYTTRDLHHELEVYRNRRNDTLDFLRNLQPGEEARAVQHPTLGELTIATIAGNTVAHDLYHLEQAAQYLR
jgi:hypothetical protein